MLEIVAAWRGLWKHRAGVALALVTLAIASSTAAMVFTVVNAVLVRPLPIRDAGHAAIIWEKRKSEAGKYGVSGADFYDWQHATASSVASMIAQDERSMILGGSEPERVMAVLSTGGFFETFGVSPVLGSPDDGRGAFLSYGLWQRRFGGDPRIAGRKIQLDGASYEIAGVLPADFRMFFGRAPADVYLPLDMPPQLRNSRDDHSFLVTARLREGASFRLLSDELDVVNSRLQHDFPKTNTGHDALVTPVITEVTASARAPLMMLSGAVALLLLLACANVANLLLARNQGRSQEMAIRQALGASWTDSAKLVLAESLILSLAAGLAGLIVAHFAIPLIRAIMPHTIGPVILPGLDHLEIDSTVMLFSAAVCGFMALAGAIVPLRRLNGSPSRWRSTKPQRILAIAQIAIACALSAGGMALTISYGRLMHVSPGFGTANRQIASLSLTSNDNASQILEAVGSMPGVKSAAMATIAPGSIGGPRTGIRLATDPPAQTIEAAKKAFFRIITPGLMRTATIRVIEGREFTDADSATSTRAMIVSRTLAERYFPGQSLIGRAMIIPFDARSWIVVGVVDDIRQLGLDQAAYPEMYFPLAQWTFGKPATMDLLLQSAAQPVSESSLRHTIAAAAPGVAVDKVRSMSELLDESTASRYFETTLLGTFATVALLIALSGLYSVIAYLVEVRRHEIAVRMAVGASPSEIVRMIAHQGAAIGAAGCAIGSGIAFALRTFAQPFLFEVAPGDPLLLTQVAAAVWIAVVLASVAPAVRAGRLPVITLLHSD